MSSNTAAGLDCVSVSPSQSAPGRRSCDTRDKRKAETRPPESKTLLATADLHSVNGKSRRTRRAFYVFAVIEEQGTWDAVMAQDEAGEDEDDEL
jgi:hypothetical protein